MDERHGAEDLLRDLARWMADQRVSEAALERSRERSWRDQAGASATWLGILVDLAERADMVEVTVGRGRRSGRVVGVGADFCVLDREGGRPALVATGSISSIVPSGPAAGVVVGDRVPHTSLSFAAAISALADHRAPVTLTTDDGDTFHGDVLSVGLDVIALREATGRVRHVALVAVAVCELR